MKNYYKILEIEFGTDINDIKKAYRKLALRYHPDRNIAIDAAERFIEITEAYEVLCDNVKRKQYDFLFNKYFKTNEKIFSHSYSERAEKAKEWAAYGRKKAEEYTSMKYDEFADRIIDELRVGISYTPNILFIIVTGTGVLTGVSAIANGYGGIGFFMLLSFGTVCYFLFQRAKEDYLAERRNKILKKYK